MKQQHTLQPKLRFPEFGVDWRELKLGSIVKINSGQTPSNFNLNNTGKYPFIKVEELNNCSKYQLKSRFYTNDDKSTIGINELIFPKRGAAILNNKIRVSKVSLIMDTNLMSLKFNGEHFYEFYYYLLLKEGLYKIADTSTIPQINNKHIEPYRLKVPSLPEQQKIADYLSTIDTKINLLEEKKAQLGLYKKAMMQKLFAQEIRFKPTQCHTEPVEVEPVEVELMETYPEWEEKRLGEVCQKTSSNLSANQIEGNSGKYKLYGATGLIQMVDFYQEDKPYISIVKDGAGVGRVLLCDEYSSVLGTLDKISPKENNNLVFIYYLLLNLNFIKYITGSTIPHIYFKDYSKEKLQIPSLQEQQKIADFLSAIDESITKVNEQITQTQSFKKAMLQQMFV